MSNVEDKISNITLELRNPELWEKEVSEAEAEADEEFGDYVLATLRYAKRFGRLVQYYLSQGKAFKKAADLASHEADTENITGNMHSGAIALLVACWEHGEKLRAWHNAKHGVKNSRGVVNPAVLVLE